AAVVHRSRRSRGAGHPPRRARARRAVPGRAADAAGGAGGTCRRARADGLPATGGTGLGSLRRLLEVVGVDLRVLRPLVRELVLGGARSHGAGLDARVAVDALLRVDVEHLDLVVVGLVRRRVDAVDRADLDARVVLLSDARLCDDVCHGSWSVVPRSGCGRAGFYGNLPCVLLLTGATGLVGSALLRRLTAAREPVRCLVRDPRRLGPERVRVQIALGDLSDPPSFRNALRGVDTVVHLAAAIRDQPHGSIEELNGI